MASATYAILAALPALFWFAYYQIKQWRGKFIHVPSFAKPRLLIGHLDYIDKEFKRLGGYDKHPDYVFENLWKEHGQPEYMFLDLRPAEYPVAVIASHEMAEQVSKSTKGQPYSTTKSPTVRTGLGGLVGQYSMIIESGESWKGFRKSFNPGFAPQHLMSLLPVILDKTTIFMDKLDEVARSGVPTELESFCTNVTFDIIGEVVTNINFHAQESADEDQNSMVRHFRYALETYLGDNGGLSMNYFDFSRKLKRYIHTRRLDAAVKECIKSKFKEIKIAQTSETKGTKDRSVLALALRDVDDLTPSVLQSIADQVKSFLMAGHDTTSILIQRVVYALSIHPQCLQKLRDEHEAIFGDADPREIFLARPDETMKALVYTSACIKEALRLWPPAGSARMSHNGLKLKDSKGDEICLDGVVLYLCHRIIQRDPAVYGETADEFVPERWVDDIDTSENTNVADGSVTGASKVPASAWRPFERGPRNCIGQELANIEVRAILACIMRRYDFTKVGMGEVETDEKGNPVVDEKGRYKTKSELINTMAITTKPFDKTVMQLKLRA